MNYPFWYVPGFGSTMLIPAIALPHVLVSHFAVGGDILLWLGIRRAYDHNDTDLLRYLRGLTRFFVLLTVVFGAITGVGIWWTIALTSPDATSTLIHAFVFGWATEWVTFVVEILSAFGLFYFWDRLAPAQHRAVALTYAVAAWLSLVIITGILSFMLSTGSWIQSHNFWAGFFNPTLVPSVIARTGGSLAITGLYLLMHVSFTSASASLRATVVHWAARWSLIGIVLIAVGGAWWFFGSPDYVRIKLLAAPVVLIIAVVSIGATTVLTAGLSLGPVTRTTWLVPPFAALLFVLGTVGLFSGEFLREAGRKPYTVQNYLYSNNVRVDEARTVSENGYVNSARWVRMYLRERVPTLFDANGQATSVTAAALDPHQRLLVGEAIYQNQCGTCHTARGYNALMPRLSAANVETVHMLVLRMNQVSHAMPPFMGQPWEADVLAEYLHNNAKGARL